jgi:putative DNA primase/helicase
VYPQPETALHGAAIAALRAGLCVIPAANDGSKRPFPDQGEWARWQQRRPGEAELAHWFGLNSHYDVLGVVCGSISGGV